VVILDGKTKPITDDQGHFELTDRPRLTAMAPRWRSATAAADRPNRVAVPRDVGELDVALVVGDGLRLAVEVTPRRRWLLGERFRTTPAKFTTGPFGSTLITSRSGRYLDGRRLVVDLGRLEDELLDGRRAGMRRKRGSRTVTWRLATAPVSERAISSVTRRRARRPSPRPGRALPRTSPAWGAW